jgi:pimeloyl-ACP methyl ester carboxylesterase
LESIVVWRFGDNNQPRPESKSQSAHLVVFLDGVQSPGVRPGAQILESFLKHGDFVQIRYPMKWGFSSGRVKKALLSLLDHNTQYEVVTFIGFSMGGLVAQEVANLVTSMHPAIRVQLMPMDAPASVHDLYQSVGAQCCRLIPAVPTPTWLNRQAFKTKEQPPREAHLSEAAKQDLFAHEMMSEVFPFGVFARQTAYIARTRLPDVIAFPTFYVQSIDDPVVRPEACRNWGKRCTHFASTRVDSPGHGLMLEFPGLWADAIESGFRWLHALKL